MTKPPDKVNDFFETCLENIRKHAPYFSLSSDRQVNEADVAHVLSMELSKQGEDSFHSVISRGKTNDPPDCEAVSDKGERIGVEVTELVDGPSVAAEKRGCVSFQEAWKPSRVIEKITRIIDRKDHAIPNGDPYELYILVVYCDDPLILDYENLKAIRASNFPATQLIDRAYFLYSYGPFEKRCPYITLRLSKVLENT
ncbi:MAG: hypothetical protein OXF20_05735 [Gammaproteobacteria bacterium]|nr:hypothetical protein [Gammaproteobacteria bacterium]